MKLSFLKREKLLTQWIIGVMKSTHISLYKPYELSHESQAPMAS